VVVVMMTVAIDHAVVAHNVMVMPHQVMVMMVVVVMMMVNRARCGHAGRQGEGDRRRERQGHEFQGLPPQ
jgi:hypothetical protein